MPNPVQGRGVETKKPGRREGDRAVIVVLRIQAAAKICPARMTGRCSRQAVTQKQVVASPLDTRRWSTDFTTQLAYVTWIQRTTSFATGFWRRWSLPEGPRRPGLPSCCVRHDLTNVIIITAARKLASSIRRELAILPRSAHGGKYSDAGKEPRFALCSLK
jgi:hypothetical protein